MAQTVPLACGHKITIGGSLKMREFRGWVDAENRGDILGVYGYLTKLIQAWDWSDLDPSNTDSYDELEMSEFRQVTQAVGAYLRSDVEAKN